MLDDAIGPSPVGQIGQNVLSLGGVERLVGVADEDVNPQPQRVVGEVAVAHVDQVGLPVVADAHGSPSSVGKDVDR